MKNRKNKVLVALSGGVDSAVSAFLLKKAGYDVVAVYFDMFGKKEGLPEAKKIAQRLEIELMKKDVRKEFEREVIRCFVGNYKKTQTPNPCVLCNPKIKFSNLLKLADELNIDQVATGHYARIQKSGEKYLLKKGVDSKKDQSYFLYRLNQTMLSRIIFPLGNKKKEEIRKIAKQNALLISQEESQNVCFFSQGETLEQFLGKHFKIKIGQIQDESGNILGKHKGLAVYTQGQRFGLGLSGGPYYVIGKNRRKNVLLVSKDKNHPLLNPRFVQVKQTSWIARKPEIGKEYRVKTRYQSMETPAKVVEKIFGGYLLDIDSLQWAPAPGQSLVFYDGEIVAGGGIIDNLA